MNCASINLLYQKFVLKSRIIIYLRQHSFVASKFNQLFFPSFDRLSFLPDVFQLTAHSHSSFAYSSSHLPICKLCKFFPWSHSCFLFYLVTFTSHLPIHSSKPCKHLANRHPHLPSLPLVKQDHSILLTSASSIMTIPSYLSGYAITPCPTLRLLPTFIIFTWIFNDSSFNLHPLHLDIQW